MRRIIALSLLYSALALGDQDGSGLQIGGAIDLVGSAQLGGDVSGLDRFAVREAEVVLYGPIDHLFDGRLSLAAHEEGGEYHFEVHEAFIGSSRLIPRSRFKIGQFFLGVGRINQFHRHDWPFISGPRYHNEFFGNGVETEAAIDSGIEYAYLLPLPFYLDLTVGLTNGWVIGHAHSLGIKPKFPTHYARLATYAYLDDMAGLQVGMSYLGRRDNLGEWTTLWGVDGTMKVKQGKVTKFLAQSEIWYRSQSSKGIDARQQLGGYVFPNYHTGVMDLMVGVRFDFFKYLNLKTSSGNPIGNIDFAFVPTLSYQPSEFTTIRLAYNWGQTRRDDSPTLTLSKFEAQAVFILGAHPAHDF